jgi:hypothetical protein
MPMPADRGDASQACASAALDEHAAVANQKRASRGDRAACCSCRTRPGAWKPADGAAGDGDEEEREDGRRRLGREPHERPARRCSECATEDITPAKRSAMAITTSWYAVDVVARLQAACHTGVPRLTTAAYDEQKAGSTRLGRCRAPCRAEKSDRRARSRRAMIVGVEHCDRDQRPQAERPSTL